MIDKEKVIMGLECCIPRNCTCQYKQEPICPYIERCQKKDYTALQRDALFLLKEQQKEIENLKQTAQNMMEGICLLKEQEAVKPVRDEQTGWLWLCGNCGSYVGFEDNDPHDPNEFDKYCRECGRPILWGGR